VAFCKGAPTLRNSLPMRQIMRVFSLLTTILLIVSPAVVAPACDAARTPPYFSQSPSADVFPNKSIIIYVADFDLQATHDPAATGNSANRNATSNVTSNVTPNVTPNVNSQASTSPLATSPVAATNPPVGAVVTPDAQNNTTKADAIKVDATKGDASADDSPRARAAKLVDLASTTLVKVLEQEGYSARRLRNGASPPDSGVVLRGVFAQVDANSGLRRAVIGGLATDAKMQLFVGIGNLARPEQPVYAVVSPQPADNIGPLISVSVYAPVGRYELDRDPSEELLKRTAISIAGDLTRLLNANPLALQQ
jgi:hypothetical protein